MSKIDTNILKDGQLAVATAPQSGTIISDASAVDATALVQTDNGPQLCVKTVEVGEGGGGGGGTVDQTYDATSTNAQSGTAVAEAVAPALKNTATGTDSLAILGSASNYKESISIGPSSQSSEGATAVGKSSVTGYYSANVGNRTNSGQISVSIGAYSSTQNSIGAIAIGGANNISNRTKALATRAIAIGSFGYGTQTVEATAQDAIQLGVGTNNTAKTLQVFEFQLLDGNTGKIPAERLDILTTAWNFSQSNCLQAKQVLDFESASTYHFVWHFITPSSTSSISQIMFGSIDVEGTGGGFDIAYNDQMKMYISQSAVGVSGWDFDAPISGTLSNSTEYWLDMTFDGTTYTYITATDKALTNVISTITNSSGKKIKNPASPAKFGAALRSGNSGNFGSGKIFMSDCKLQLDSTVVFDGAHGSQWKIVGTPSVVSTLS